MEAFTQTLTIRWHRFSEELPESGRYLLVRNLYQGEPWQMYHAVYLSKSKLCPLQEAGMPEYIITHYLACLWAYEDEVKSTLQES